MRLSAFAFIGCVWLGGIPVAVAAKDCANWNKWKFFKTVTVEEVATCLEAGASLNAQDFAGRSPIHVAASVSTDPAVVAALLGVGADPNMRNSDGYTPLYFAARNNTNPAIISVLLNAGADANAGTKGSFTLLHTAAAGNKNPAVFATLLDPTGRPFPLPENSSKPACRCLSCKTTFLPAGQRLTDSPAQCATLRPSR